MLPSALIDKPAPQKTLPALDAQTQGFGPKELASGKVGFGRMLEPDEIVRLALK